MKKILALLLYLSLTTQTHAAGFIRDAEIEGDVRKLAAPIFRSAGLDPAGVRIFIVQDDSINAFVAGGQNIFLHTGLLLACETPEMLLGVIAHETGHIAGGHIARGAEAISRAEIGTVISYVLGAVAFAHGAGNVGMAVLSGGASTVERSILSFTRANEDSADQAALRFLNQNHISADGMLAMFEKLRREEKRHFDKIDPYILTHPLGPERIANIRDAVKNSPYGKNKLPAQAQERHKRMLAKLIGFLQPLNAVLLQYPSSDNSPAAHYARAVAWYRSSDLSRSLSELDGLIKTAPKDAYFYELKGQILFENARINESVKAYEQAIKLAPNEPLIRTGYAQSLLANNQPMMAAKELERASKEDNSYNLIWRLLAESYGKIGQNGMAQMALAEMSMLENDAKLANQHAEIALKTLPKNSPHWYRVSDIQAQAKRMMAEKNSGIDDKNR